MRKILYKLKPLLMAMRTVSMPLIGMLLFVVGVSWHTAVNHQVRQKALWPPLVIPLNAQQRVIRAEFTPEFNELHQIQIERSLEPPDRKQVEAPMLLGDIKIDQAGQVIYQDQIQVNYNLVKREFSSSTGRFRALAHRTYKVDLTIQQANAKFYALKPSLKIRLNPMYVKGYVSNRVITAVIMQFLGLFLMLGFLLRKVIAFSCRVLHNR
jgi:small basic protein